MVTSLSVTGSVSGSPSLVLIKHTYGVIVDIPDPGHGDTLSATFYGRLDGSNTADTTVKPGCKLTATWSKSFQDIYYGEDNCLYDGDSQSLKGEDGNPLCCEEQDIDEEIANPYLVGTECQHS